MYQHVLLTLAIASAPLAASVQPQTAPAAQKPAPPAAGQKPGTEKPAAAAKGVRTVEIVGTDDMKYSVTSIPAKRGEQLRVRLTTKSAMPKVAMAHNFVLLQKAASQVKFVQAAATARDTEFVPAALKDQVIAATKLAGGGETVEVTFKVPDVAGDYPFLCSFPGHFQVGMRGTLSVK